MLLGKLLAKYPKIKFRKCCYNLVKKSVFYIFCSFACFMLSCLSMTQTQLSTEIDSIKKQLIEKYKAEKIILFGSAVTGRITPDSDLDFFIIKDEKKSLHDRLATLYRLVKTPIPVDFLVYTPKEFAKRAQLGDPFVKSILATGRILYG